MGTRRAPTWNGETAYRVSLQERQVKALACGRVPASVQASARRLLNWGSPAESGAAAQETRMDTMSEDTGEMIDADGTAHIRRSERMGRFWVCLTLFVALAFTTGSFSHGLLVMLAFFVGGFL